MSQPESNPFQAPVQSNVKAPAKGTNEAVLDFIVIAEKWERYRLIYNVALIVATVGLGGLGFLFVGLVPMVELAVVAVLGAITVNFFFFLGPALDGYCQWIFDSQSKAFGKIIFVLGTLFSLVLVAVTVIGIAAGAALP